MPRYRYITCGLVSPDDLLSRFRLIGANRLGFEIDCLRVTIPDDVKLDKQRGQLYLITDSDLKIKDLEPVALARFNGRMQRCDGLWPRPPHEWGHILSDRGYYPTHDGYVTTERYREMFLRRR